jgi:hypothetical protein
MIDYHMPNLLTNFLVGVLASDARPVCELKYHLPPTYPFHRV